MTDGWTGNKCKACAGTGDEYINPDKPIVEGTEEGRWKHPLETLEHPVAGWTLVRVKRVWGVGTPVEWSVSLMHEASGAVVFAKNSTIDLALSDACAEANRAEIVEPTDV